MTVTTRDVIGPSGEFRPLIHDALHSRPNTTVLKNTEMGVLVTLLTISWPTQI
jgi:hypothetical protein